MPLPDRTHLQNFPVDEFEAIFRSEDAGLPHAVVFVHGEAFLADLCFHTGSFSRSIPQRYGGCQAGTDIVVRKGKQPENPEKLRSQKRDKRDYAFISKELVPFKVFEDPEVPLKIWQSDQFPENHDHVLKITIVLQIATTPYV